MAVVEAEFFLNLRQSDECCAIIAAIIHHTRRMDIFRAVAPLCGDHRTSIAERSVSHRIDIVLKSRIYLRCFDRLGVLLTRPSITSQLVDDRGFRARWMSRLQLAPAVVAVFFAHVRTRYRW